MLKSEIETVSFIIYLLNAPLTKIFILYSGFTEGCFRSSGEIMNRIEISIGLQYEAEIDF